MPLPESDVSRPDFDLDFNAGAPPDRRVVEAMRSLGPEADGNPHAPHWKGRAARRLLENARERIADVLELAPDEVLFCSGGTEANNIALACGRQAHARTGLPIGVSTIEHPSIDVPARALEEEAPSVIVRLAWDSSAQLPAQALSFASCILAQGEFGFVQDLEALRRALDASGEASEPAPLHTDASQALGRMSIVDSCRPADLITLSPHKAGGPRGVGVLVVREGVPFRPVLRGGAQELGRRPGTQVPRLAHGAALAIELAEREHAQRAAAMRAAMDVFLGGLSGLRARGEVLVLGEDLVPVPRERILPNTRTIAMPGVEARVLLPALDLAGIAASYGSACSSGALEPSPALRGLPLEAALLSSCLRVSLGASPNCENIEQAAGLFSQVLARIRRPRGTSSR